MNIYLTVTGINFHEGKEVFKVGAILQLLKEPENNYDEEAIGVLDSKLNKLGYIANSVSTVAKGTMSAGRAGVFLNELSRAKVLFITHSQVIIEVVEGINKDIVDIFTRDKMSEYNESKAYEEAKSY